MVPERRKYLWILGSLIAALFVAGVVWRALNPQASENPDEDVQIASRQDGYYLCLHRSQLSPAEMYRLIKRRLPDDDLTYALRGCQEAQRR
jgi:hypothetical protein